MQEKNIFKEVKKNMFSPNIDVILFSFIINLNIISLLQWIEFNELLVHYI